ncbi:hypothetical protein RR46_10405 [Papilio xuthus]|uniref:Uncharacterized protein n=1 Tax=Papilio xuthus TaxID=66420 RepID=A0A194Q0I0_PAPXU|nr:hypothetical protein RR46_10405 [Papilio xuthus]
MHAFVLRYRSALRKVPTQMPPHVRAGPPTKRVKRVSWRDAGEAGEASEDAGGGGQCAGDPAVLALGPARRPLVYPRDLLLRLRHSPLVKRGLEHAFRGCDAALALVLKKGSDSPNDDDRGAKGDAPNDNHKVSAGGGGGGGGVRERRAADPRERVRRESEGSGIVLSPQRRSFVSGCGAPAPPAPPPRPDSPHHPHPHPHPHTHTHTQTTGKTAEQVTETLWTFSNRGVITVGYKCEKNRSV